MTLTTKTRNIPPNAETRPHPAGLGTVYIYTGKYSDRPAAIAYGGARTKADWHYTFRTAAQMEAQIAEWFARLTETAARKQDRANYRKLPHTIPVGAILYNAWGHEQTNIDWYQVVTVTAHRVTVRRLAGHLSREFLDAGGATSAMCGECVPCPNQFLSMEETTHTVTLAQQDAPYIGFTYGAGRVWDGTPKYCSWYG